MGKFNSYITNKFTKQNVKNIVNKINFKRWILKVIILIIIGFILIIFAGLKKEQNVMLIGLWCGIIGMILGFIILMLYFLKLFIDDLGKVAMFLICISYYFYIVIMYGIGINKISSKFPEVKNELMQLFIYSFTGIIPAIIGILGTYFAAVYAGKKAIEATEKQLNAVKENEKEEQRKNEVITIRIISKLLRQEIEQNMEELKRIILLLNDKNYNRKDCFYNIPLEHLSFRDYDNVKYEIIKYCNQDIMEMVVDIYDIFRTLLKYKSINEISDKDYSKLCKLDVKYKCFIKTLEDKELY